MGLFSKKSNDRWTGKSGVYKIEGNSLIELDEELAKVSINDVIKSIDYLPDQIHTINTFDSSLVEIIGVKLFTKEPVLVWAKNKGSKLKFSELRKELKKVDWDFEYASSGVEYILKEGIANRSLSLDFMKSVLNMEEQSDSIYEANELGLFLLFEGGFLNHYSSSDWLNAPAKEYKSLNEPMFNSMMAEANEYHSSNIDAIEEVNLQCKALWNLPEMVNNEFIPLHVKETGNINYYNLLAAHYHQIDGENIDVQDFKTVNKGRYKELDSQTFQVGEYIYRFDANGILIWD